MIRYRSIILSALLAIAIFLGLLEFLDSQDSLSKLYQLPIKVWAALLVITSLHILIRFIRWRTLLAATIEHRIGSLMDLLALYISGFALTLVPSKLGENVRAIFLRERGVPYSTTITIFFIERFLDVAAVALLAILYFVPEGDSALTVALLSLACVLLFSLGLIQWLPLGILSSERFEQLRFSLENLRAIHSVDRLKILSLSFLAWWLQSTSLWIVLFTLSQTVGLIVSSAIYALSLLAGAVSLMPGGLGVTELTAAYSLERSGIQFDIALLAMTITRFTTLWYAVFLGIISYVYCVRKARQSTESKSITKNSP